MVLLSRELKEIRARAATATESERAELEYRETEIQRRYYDLARGSDPDTITEGIEYTVAHYLAADSAGFDATRRADLVYAGVATILRRGPRRGQREFCQFMEGYAAGYGDGLAREKDATGRHVLRPEVAPGERPPLVLRLHPAPEPRPRSRR
jgi:hypothetical protein